MKRSYATVILFQATSSLADGSIETQLPLITASVHSPILSSTTMHLVGNIAFGVSSSRGHLGARSGILLHDSECIVASDLAISDSPQRTY